jgi:hypothetical protein
MKGDFSRVTFDPTRHFSQVLMQQGRVLLADDLNEASDIFTYLLRTFIGDAVGPYAGPATGAGFAITAVTNTIFKVGEGRYWVDGILCQNEQDMDWPPPNPDPKATQPPLRSVLVYLDVWERHVSAVELDDIREKALGGPDTATRAQMVWQVGTWPATIQESPTVTPTDKTDPDGMLAWWRSIDAVFQDLIDRRWPRPRGLVKATLASTVGYKDACITPPQAGYRGDKNHLYRIEVNKGGKIGDHPTFKWSRENGSVETSWLDTDDKDLLVVSSGLFSAGDWVELLDDDVEFAGAPASLLQLIDVKAGRLTLANPPAVDLANRANSDSQRRHPRVRRWDQKFTKAAQGVQGCVEIRESLEDAPDWIDLENGIRIQFVKPVDANVENEYRTGDYWLIPARVATAGLDLPGETTDGVFVSDALKPREVTHHYAPLAYINADGNSIDLRRLIAPCLTRPTLPG